MISNYKNISVIIPVYNAEKTLRRCVESLVFGTYQDIEVILIDDCSNDKSWDLCKALQKQFDNVICYKNSSNKGVSFTRNKGLEIAEGKYVFFVDSDDWVSGRYIELLFGAAASRSDLMPICGFKLIDQVNDIRQDYIWSSAKRIDERMILPPKEWFSLLERTLFQQLWNKAFRKEIIDRYHLRFDETESMGEDFQFVIDYLEASGIENCQIVNEPLYYYTRVNNNSLMSQFGLTELKNDNERLKRLLKLSGEDDPENVQRFVKAINNAKHNSVYRAVHNNSWTKSEKLVFIESIMNDGLASRYYKEQHRILIKEKLKTFVLNVKRIPDRAKNKITRARIERLISLKKRQLIAKGFSIISQNCIGGVVYHDMGMMFASPTINLYFKATGFIKFVLGIEKYMNQEPRMLWGEEYPIGFLDDIEIHFQHYSSCTEAREKWEERKKRINLKKIIILSTDRDGFSEEVYEQWKKIPYPKVLFSATERNAAGTIYYPEYKDVGMVDDLIPERKFYKGEILINTLNEIEL